MPENIQVSSNHCLLIFILTSPFNHELIIGQRPWQQIASVNSLEECFLLLVVSLFGDEVVHEVVHGARGGVDEQLRVVRQHIVRQFWLLQLVQGQVQEVVHHA